MVVSSGGIVVSCSAGMLMIPMAAAGGLGAFIHAFSPVSWNVG